MTGYGILTMIIRRKILFITIAFALLPLVLPTRQLAVGESATPLGNASSEATAVLELVKELDAR